MVGASGASEPCKAFDLELPLAGVGEGDGVPIVLRGYGRQTIDATA